MNEKQFLDTMTEYLESQKVFIQNPQRMKDVSSAYELAQRLFPDSKIELKDDPIQMGAIFLCVEDFDISVRETEIFSKLISKADNFEIYATGDENVRISIMFSNALIRI